MEINKKKFIDIYIQSYVEKHFSNNYNYHIEFCKSVEQLTACKKDDDIIHVYRKMRYIYNHSEIKEHSQQLQNMIMKCRDEPPFSDNDINNYIYSHTEVDSLALSVIRDKVTEQTFTLLNIIYRCMINSCEFENSIKFIKYLMAMKKKDIFLGKIDIDIFDILFNMLVYISKLGTKEMYKFVSLSRNIMYFRIPRKDIYQRINIFWGTIVILYDKNLLFTPLKYPAIHVEKPHKYLYVICNKDDDLQSFLDNEKKQRMYNETIKRRVQVQNVSTGNNTANIQIIKGEKENDM